MLATMQKMCVIPSFSRPSVSYDNPFSEALFKTLKYVPAYPTQLFGSIDAARRWIATFCAWYNHSHRHSGLKFVTPVQRHDGTDKAILAQRKGVYEKARRLHLERWAGRTRNLDHVEAVELNPGSEHTVNIEMKKAA